MKLLFDTDAFCKLGTAAMLEEVASLFSTELTECGRLQALTHMLRRGKLRRSYGAETCDRLLPIASVIPPIQQPSDKWLDMLIPVQAIDPGEAQLFAVAAEDNITIVSGDKRALRALKDVEIIVNALSGRVVVLEALFLELCNHLGANELRRRISPLALLDKMLQVCCSTGNPDLEEGLRSYYQSLVDELKPLIIWSPRTGGKT